MHPNDDVVMIDAVCDLYDGGGGPVKYVGASDKSPIESSRLMCAAAVDGLVLSALLVLCPKIEIMRCSMLPSASLFLALVGLPCRDRNCSSGTSLIDTPTFTCDGGASASVPAIGRRIDPDCMKSIGGASGSACSYGLVKTGVEFERQ
jgi:hypothetical protein